MKIRWAETADADLDHIIWRIAEDSVTAALRMQDRIEAAVQRLDRMPRRTRVGRLPDTRELIVARSPYVVVFKVGSDGIDVIRVLHGAQDWPPKES